MSRKYELTEYSAEVEGVTVHQIRAVVDLPGAGIAAGDFGGYVANDTNLDHDGECWVFGVEGRVDRSAVVLGEARVTGDSRIHDLAMVAGRARVGDFTAVFDTCQIIDDADVELQSDLTGGAVIFGSARVRTGQDGPFIVAGAAIDFDVEYGTPFITLGDSEERWMFSVSTSGRICEAGSWGRPRWSGDLVGMRAIVAENPDDRALPALLAAAETYLS